MFKLVSDYSPSGDQPQAINALINGFNHEKQDQVLLGVTGSGKTFTMANVIAAIQKPTIILAPNKTLAAQLYGEMKEFFPENSVEYFVSYYDYYRPEAYIPKTDTYIEKEATINEYIDRMRHSATRALMDRSDVIVVASISCIYGIGSPETYQKMTVTIKNGELINKNKLLRKFVELQYQRNDVEFARGTFRSQGDTVEIFPSHAADFAWRISLFGDEIESLNEFDPVTGKKTKKLSEIKLYPNSHYATPSFIIHPILKEIRHELNETLKELESENKLLEAQRLKERTNFDLEMLQATGHCRGIENYSRYLTGRNPGEPPPTLFEYVPKNGLLIVDESHISIPQLGAMYEGDKVRKGTLVKYGFRLPSCKDNRPLKFEEWNEMRPKTVFVSATPGPWELKQTNNEIIEQIIRPTGLVDPECFVIPTENQIDDLIDRLQSVINKGYRALVTTLTKKMSESLTEYIAQTGIKVRYLHSDVDTLERIEIIRDLRKGAFNVLVGINLLREGLDIPECGLVAILDADKEGFLRSKTSLIQTIGRAARNVDGYVVLYADTITGTMRFALDETERRRNKQKEYNKKHGITPETIKKSIKDILESVYEHDSYTVQKESEFSELTDKELEKQMLEAAQNLEFELATKLRNEILNRHKHKMNSKL